MDRLTVMEARSTSAAARRLSAVILMIALLSDASISPSLADPLPEVDTALILAVDVSESVDEQRYRLQMEGIARALEDEGVQAAIASGAKGAIALALVEWADRAEPALDWQIIAGAEDARRVAARIRSLSHRRGEYTCTARMMSFIESHVLATTPAAAARVVLDVSGDGIDNCDDGEADRAARDALVARGVTINGLPIRVAGASPYVGAGAYRAPGYGLREVPLASGNATVTLEGWYATNVIGGPASFLITADGYEDFGRAIRQKFVSEISSAR
ncbi:MAG: DUF1194 domain-containing protein [Hyphomicrobium sp.]